MQYYSITNYPPMEYKKNVLVDLKTSCCKSSAPLGIEMLIESDLQVIIQISLAKISLVSFTHLLDNF